MKTERKNKEQRRQVINGFGSSAAAFEEYLRRAVRRTLWELMQEEVEALCGRKHRPLESRANRRAGSEAGIFYFAGRKEALKRPRVRQRRAGGGEQEVRLASYEQARQQENIEGEVMAMMEEGWRWGG